MHALMFFFLFWGVNLIMHNQFDDFICYVCQSLGLIRYLLRNGPYFQIEYLQKYSPFPIT